MPLAGGGGGGGASTVIVAVSATDSDVALIIAVPPDTPVTSPLVDTVATAALRLRHAMVRPVSTVPAASRTVADSCTVPAGAIVAVCGATVTDAAGAGGGASTVTSVPADLPSLLAVIVAVPTATPVTSPLSDTVAVPADEVAQVMVRPVRTLPFASRAVAVICTVLPTMIFGVVGATLTDATGISWTVTVAEPDLPSLV